MRYYHCILIYIYRYGFKLKLQLNVFNIKYKYLITKAFKVFKFRSLLVEVAYTPLYV